jgi:hypothetical protein
VKKYSLWGFVSSKGCMKKLRQCDFNDDVDAVSCEICAA